MKNKTDITVGFIIGLLFLLVPIGIVYLIDKVLQLIFS